MGRLFPRLVPVLPIACVSKDRPMMDDYYLWIKAWHVISVICWMVPLFYLPRLFVYHNDTPSGSDTSDLFLIMERRLIKIIMNPAMLLTYGSGATLIFMPGGMGMTDGWLHLKIALVFGLSAYHGLLIKWSKEFKRGERNHQTRFFRLANEIPTVIMSLIIILVIIKPF